MAYLGDPAKYFTIHHSPADTVERIAPEEVSRAAAAIAVMAYVVAEMPERLPKDSCDAHLHVFGDVAAYPVRNPNALYRPPEGMTFEELSAYLDFGKERIAQASCGRSSSLKRTTNEA